MQRLPPAPGPADPAPAGLLRRGVRRPSCHPALQLPEEQRGVHTACPLSATHPSPSSKLPKRIMKSFFLRRAHLGDSLSAGQLTQPEGEPGGGRARRAGAKLGDAGNCRRRWGDCCGRSWEPTRGLCLCPGRTQTRTRREKTPGTDSQAHLASRGSGGGQSPLWPPRSAWLPLERPPGSAWPPTVRNPACQPTGPTSAPGGATFPSIQAVCASPRFSPVVTSASLGAREDQGPRLGATALQVP